MDVAKIVHQETAKWWVEIEEAIRRAKEKEYLADIERVRRKEAANLEGDGG